MSDLCVVLLAILATEVLVLLIWGVVRFWNFLDDMKADINRLDRQNQSNLAWEQWVTEFITRRPNKRKKK